MKRLFAITLAVGLTMAAAGQSYVIGPLEYWWNGGIQTTGGITYFVHRNSSLTDCFWVESSPPTWDGTNVSLAVAEMQAFNCIGDQCHSDTNAVVLGSLPAGG